MSDNFMLPLANRHPFFKLVAYGEPGSGKTRLLANLAIGLRARLHSSLPIGVLDTEHAAKDLLPVFRASGLGPQDVLVRESKDLGDLIQFLDLAKAGKFSVAIVDSLSWFWDATLSLSKVQLELKTRSLSATERGDAKAWWRETVSLKIAQDPMHLLCAARAGAAWDSERDEDTGRREGFKSGVRMRSEGDQGYEFGLVVRCERHEDEKGEVWRTATVEKDRTGEIDGESWGVSASEAEEDSPVYAGYSCFAPAVEAVLDEPAPPVKGASTSPPVIFNAAGGGSRERENAATRKALILDEIEAWLEGAYPGAGKEAEKEKRLLRTSVFGTPAVGLAKTLDLPVLEVKHAVMARILKNRATDGEGYRAPPSFRREGEGPEWFEEKKPEPTAKEAEKEMTDAMFGADEIAEGGNGDLAPPGSAPGVKTEAAKPSPEGPSKGENREVPAQVPTPPAAGSSLPELEAAGKILPQNYATCVTCGATLNGNDPNSKTGFCELCHAVRERGPVKAWGEDFALTSRRLEGEPMARLLRRGADKLGGSEKDAETSRAFWLEAQRVGQFWPVPKRVDWWVQRVEKEAASAVPVPAEKGFREGRPLQRKKTAHRGSSGADRACGEKVDDPPPKIQKAPKAKAPKPSKCPKCKKADVPAGEIVCASCKVRMDAEADATPVVPEGASS